MRWNLSSLQDLQRELGKAEKALDICCLTLAQRDELIRRAAALLAKPQGIWPGGRAAWYREREQWMQDRGVEK